LPRFPLKNWWIPFSTKPFWREEVKPVKQILLLLLLFCILGFSGAQENEGEKEWENEEENWDSIFNNDFEDLVEEEEEPGNSVVDSMNRSRVTLHADYNFFGGFSPGWSELPWYNDKKKEFTYVLGAKMESLLSLDFQLAENLRVWNSFYFSIPPDSSNFLTLKEFYFDYDINKVVFFRAGQYGIAWGISPFFPFTNLPARIPADKSEGDSYIIKIDIPIGLGGLQILGMTRYGFMDNPASPKLDEIAFGTKYNLALQAVDIDWGAFYFGKMPLRFFASAKTTLGKTELYLEGLAATIHDEWDTFYFSGNIGVVRDFFKGKLTVGGEVFYNGESDSYWYRAKEDIRDAESIPLFKGWNSALNVILRPGVANMRIFCQCLYAIDLNSVQLVPGISIKPFKQLTATLSVPMALGNRDSNTYYGNNADTNNRPFSIVLGLSITGSFRYRIYMDRSAD